MATKINKSELKESQNTEFKSSWRDDYLKTLAAFANSDGGSLYIGLNDKGTPVPLTKTKKLLEDIPNKCNDKIGILPKVDLLILDSLEVIKVTVEKQDAPISYNGRFYSRTGSTTQELNGSSLTQFLMKKSVTPWDEAIEPSATIEDIDEDTIEHFKKLAKNRAPFISTESSIEVLLEKLNLMHKKKIRRAAILLFGKNPKAYYPGAVIRIGKFLSDTDLEATEEIDGNLFQQIERCIETFRNKFNLLKVEGYKGAVREERFVYPPDAIREAIINAILHKDYSGVHSQFLISENALEIWNPGRLPDGITSSSLSEPHRSIPRNRLIADIFFKANLIESWGRGTLKIVESCRENKISPPIFQEESNGFKLSLIKDRFMSRSFSEKYSLNDRQLEILRKFQNHQDFAASEIKDLFSEISDATLRRDLSDLVEKSLLSAEGQNKQRRYAVL